MVKIAKSVSDKISALSFICTCMVVLIHVPIPSTHLSSGWYLSEFLSYGICLISVPYFFIFSGFFLGKHIEEEGWWFNAIKKRVKSLLIPYIIFNLLYSFYTSDFFSNPNITVLYLIKVAFGSPFEYPTLGPLWYVRSLFFYVIISPIFKRITGLGILTMFFISAIFLISLIFIPNNKFFQFFRFSFSVPNLPYFVTGLYLARNNIDVLSKRTSFFLLMMASCILFIKIYLEVIGIQVPMVWRLFFCPLLIVSLWNLIPNISFSPFLTSLSFPIYLIHYFFISVLPIFGCDTNSVMGFFLSYSIMLLGAVLLCIIISRVFSASFVNVLWGGR